MKAVHRLYNNRTQNGHPGCPSDWPAAVNGPLGAGVYRLIPRDWVQAWRRYIKGDVEMERPKFDGIPADLYRCRHGLSLVPTHVLAFVGPVIGAVTPRADVMSAIGDGPVGLPSAAAPVDVPVDGNGGNYSSGGGGNRAAPVKRRRTGGVLHPGPWTWCWMMTWCLWMWTMTVPRAPWWQGRHCPRQVSSTALPRPY